MDNTLYIALSRQTALLRQMDVVANNIANVDTTGYRSENMLFDKYVVQAEVDGKKGKTGELAFTQDIATVTDPSQGTLQVTDRPFDMAIQGKGFFVVQTPLGERYTRAGNFQLDANGVLTTAQGYPVLDEGRQQIVLENIQGDVVVGETGGITVDGNEVAQIGVVQFENEQLLDKVGNSLFKSDVAPAAADNYRIVHGVVEKSNVNSVQEMNHMITVSRNVSSVGNIISEVDDLQLNAIRTLAKQSQ